MGLSMPGPILLSGFAHPRAAPGGSHGAASGLPGQESRSLTSHVFDLALSLTLAFQTRLSRPGLTRQTLKIRCHYGVLSMFSFLELFLLISTFYRDPA